LQRPNREEGSKSNQSNNGREPHQLSGRCWYPDSQPVAHQNIFEQCHIDTRSQVCRCRSRQLLPHDSIEKTQYAKIKLSDLPEEVIKEYNSHQYATPDGWVYIKVSRGMYGLPQAGSLGHDLLEQRLNKEGYFQSQLVPALWKHNTKPIQFVLVIDDFGIKYLKKEDLDHLIQTLEKHYDVSVDLEGKEFVKMH
jgi:hypothetical protein